MRNPTRRNKNIGTSKQGYGQNNRLKIPDRYSDSFVFYERLGKYTKTYREINGNRFEFVIEETREGVRHACTVDDLAKMIRHIPPADYEDLNLIVLRQPTRKQETLSSVWGRLIYSYEFENDYRPAIILEAMDCERAMKWSKKLTPNDKKELDRLRKDGHPIVEGKRFYTAVYEVENVRNTQLYRTFPHEFGHYVHYLNVVVKPLEKMKAKLDKLDAQIDDEDTAETNPLFLKWEKMDEEYDAQVQKNRDKYFSISSAEKETFAHNYADKLIKKWRLVGLFLLNQLNHQFLKILPINKLFPLSVLNNRKFVRFIYFCFSNIFFRKNTLYATRHSESTGFNWECKNRASNRSIARHEYRT